MASAALSRSFSDLIVGQQEIRAQLAESLRAGCTAHAYLFCGPEGIGKIAVALEFAALLLCDQPESRPCGICPQCQATRFLQHPDLHMVLPLPPLKSDLTYEEEQGHFAQRIESTLKALATDPYASLTGEISRQGKSDSDRRERIQKVSIRISAVRRLVQVAARKPYQARRNVFVISEADRMNPNAQNALLKCLEEPFENSYFLLVTENERDLLPTVRSRCRTVRMRPVAADEILKALVAEGADATAAKAASVLSAGDFGYARTLAKSDLATIEDRVVSYLRAAAACNPLELQKVIGAQGGDRSTDDQAFLGLLARFLRDVSLVRAADAVGSSPSVAFGRSEPVIRRLLSSYPAADLDTMALWVDRTSGWLELGYSRDYLLYALAIRLCEALGTRSPSKQSTRDAAHA